MTWIRVSNHSVKEIDCINRPQIVKKNVALVPVASSTTAGPSLNECSDIGVALEGSKERPLHGVLPQDNPYLFGIRQHIFIIGLRSEVLVEKT